MKYNPYEFDGEMVCKLRATLRIDDYVGHVWHKYVGDEPGKQALDLDFFDFENIERQEDIGENDCGLLFHPYCGFRAELKNDKKDIYEIRDECPEFMNGLITAVEIVDCYKEKSCYTCGEWEPGFERCCHPDQPQSLADDYMAPRDHCCDLWEK